METMELETTAGALARAVRSATSGLAQSARERAQIQISTDGWIAASDGTLVRRSRIPEENRTASEDGPPRTLILASDVVHGIARQTPAEDTVRIQTNGGDSAMVRTKRFRAKLNVYNATKTEHSEATIALDNGSPGEPGTHPGLKVQVSAMALVTTLGACIATLHSPSHHSSTTPHIALDPTDDGTLDLYATDGNSACVASAPATIIEGTKDDKAHVFRMSKACAKELAEMIGDEHDDVTLEWTRTGSLGVAIENERWEARAADIPKVGPRHNALMRKLAERAQAWRWTGDRSAWEDGMRLAGASGVASVTLVWSEIEGWNVIAKGFSAEDGESTHAIEDRGSGQGCPRGICIDRSRLSAVISRTPGEGVTIGSADAGPDDPGMAPIIVTAENDQASGDGSTCTWVIGRMRTAT